MGHIHMFELFNQKLLNGGIFRFVSTLFVSCDKCCARLRFVSRINPLPISTHTLDEGVLNKQ